MKKHIDALFDFLTHNHGWEGNQNIHELYGILYTIGSQWDYYEYCFTEDD